MNAKEAYETLRLDLWHWLKERGFELSEDGVYQVDAWEIYHSDMNYLWWTSLWHSGAIPQAWFDIIAEGVGPGVRVLDVGAGHGFSGLSLGMMTGAQVDFYDFDKTSLGAEFIRAMGTKYGLSLGVYEYGEEIGGYDLVVAADLLEHTGNHLAGLRWIGSLGKRMHMCYPVSVEYLPPYVKRVDDWVDDEVIMSVIPHRYALEGTDVADSRRFVSFHQKEA